MKTVRYGIIGLGNQGSTYIKEFFNPGKVENAEITALCDINPDKIALAKEYTQGRKIAFFTDYKAMLESGLIDAAMVETPHYYHPEMAQECLKRGIHVLVEKPAGVYAKQVKEMNETAAKSGAIFGMMFNQRTNCVYRKMREIIANGEIGELQRVVWVITNWYRSQSYYDSSNWRATWNGEGGGVLINQALHTLDLVQWFCGFPSEVYANCENYLHKRAIEVEDTVTAVFKGEANFDFFATSCAASDLPVTVELKTENGAVLLLPDCAVANGKMLAIDESRTYFGKCDYGRGHNSLIADFYSCVSRGEKFWINGEEGAKVVKLILAVYESNGKEVKIGEV